MPAGYQLLKMIRQTLYRLKRSYGMPLVIYCQSAETVDLTTGAKTVTKIDYSVSRAVMLPVNVLRQNLFTGGSTEANKSFSYGGILQLGDRIVVIDSRDLPAGVTIGLENYFAVVQNRRYEVKSVEELDCNAGYIVVLRELKGARVFQFIHLSVKHKLFVDDVGVGT